MVKRRHPKHRLSGEKAKKGTIAQRFGRRLSAILHVYRRRWFQVFASGLVLLALMEVSYLVASNANLVPAMILYGAFLVPITLIVYLYERLTAWEIPMPLLLICLLCGGALGVAIASPLEIDLLPPLGPFQFFGVGLIEESSKLIVPAAVFLIGAYRSEAAGVIVGFASAMGFSALETAGYGFNAFMGNTGGGDTNTLATILKEPMSLLYLDSTFVERSLLDPVGHGTWTILTCYVLFHERRKAGRMVVNWRVGGAFVLAILLHAAWDTSLIVTPSTGYEEAAVRIAFVVPLVLTFWLLGRIVRKTREAQATAAKLEP